MSKNFLLALVSVVLTYAAVEGVATYAYWRGWIEPFSIWFLEKEAPGISNVKFDPVVGYKLSSKPMRMGAYTTNGGVHTYGHSQGNNYGFPDRNDFQPQRKDKGTIRVAVFGDSYTAAQYVPTAWPETTEKILNDRGHQIELMNWALDGSGLGNWWAIVKRVLEKEDFDIDALVFMVWSSDLDRSFMWWDDEIYLEKNHPKDVVAVGYSQDWQVEKFPKTRQELQPSFLDRFHLLSPQQMDQLLAGDLVLPTGRTWSPYLWKLFWTQFFPPAEAKHQPAPPPLGGFSSAKKRALIEEIRLYAEAKGIPIFVVNQADLMGEGATFAELLKAPITDCNLAFSEVTPAKVSKDYFIPLDGHFMPEGMDHWARFMADTIEIWLDTGMLGLTSEPEQ